MSDSEKAIGIAAISAIPAVLRGSAHYMDTKATISSTEQVNQNHRMSIEGNTLFQFINNGGEIIKNTLGAIDKLSKDDLEHLKSLEKLTNNMNLPESARITAAKEMIDISKRNGETKEKVAEAYSKIMDTIGNSLLIATFSVVIPKLFGKKS